MSKESIIVSIIKEGPLKNSWIFDPNWTSEDIEFLRQYKKPFINVNYEEDDIFFLSEAELIVSALKDRMESYLSKIYQGKFDINDCRNELEVIKVLEEIENDSDASDDYSAEAFRAYVYVKPICNLIKKYKI